MLTTAQTCLVAKSRLTVRSTSAPFSPCMIRNFANWAGSVMVGTLKQTLIGPATVGGGADVVSLARAGELVIAGAGQASGCGRIDRRDGSLPGIDHTLEGSGHVVEGDRDVIASRCLHIGVIVKNGRLKVANYVVTDRVEQLNEKCLIPFANGIGVHGDRDRRSVLAGRYAYCSARGNVIAPRCGGAVLRRETNQNFIGGAVRKLDDNLHDVGSEITFLDDHIRRLNRRQIIVEDHGDGLVIGRKDAIEWVEQDKAWKFSFGSSTVSPMTGIDTVVWVSPAGTTTVPLVAT